MCTNQIQIKYKSNTNQIQIKYKSNTNQIQIKYKSNTNQIQIKYKSNTNQIQIKYKSNTNAPFQLRLSPWCFDAAMTCSDAFGRFFRRFKTLSWRFYPTEDAFWTLFGRFLDAFWALFGRFLDAFWALFGCFLDAFWTFLDAFWTLFGRFLDAFWMLFGRFLDAFWTLLDALCVIIIIYLHTLLHTIPVVSYSQISLNDKFAKMWNLTNPFENFISWYFRFNRHIALFV